MIYDGCATSVWVTQSAHTHTHTYTHTQTGTHIERSAVRRDEASERSACIHVLAVAHAYMCTRARARARTHTHTSRQI